MFRADPLHFLHCGKCSEVREEAGVFTSIDCGVAQTYPLLMQFKSLFIPLILHVISLGPAAWAATTPLNAFSHPFTSQCRKNFAFTVKGRGDVTDLSGEQNSGGMFWRFGRHEFRLYVFELPKTGAVPEFWIYAHHTLTHSEGADFVSGVNTQHWFAVTAKGKIVEGHQRDVIWQDQRDPQITMSYKLNTEGETVLHSRRDLVNDPAGHPETFLYRFENTKDTGGFTKEIDLKKAYVTCTYRRLGALPDVVTSQPEFERRILEFNQRIQKLEQMEQGMKTCGTDAAACAESRRQLEWATLVTVDRWSRLFKLSDLQKLKRRP